MRKRKLALIAILLVCFSTVVHASTMHGDYKGEPIIKVYSQGKELRSEDVPATIQDGRATVPLYLLRQAGASVTWSPESYRVDITLPQPVNSFEKFISKIKEMNTQVNEYDAKNLKLIFNEYGSYLQVDLQMSQESNIDNDRIMLLSGFITNTPVDMMIVHHMHRDQQLKYTVIKREDAEDFYNKKIVEYQFIEKWRSFTSFNKVDLSNPNKPPASVEPTSSFTNTFPKQICWEIRNSYSKLMKEAVIEHNERASASTKTIEEYLNILTERMEAVLEKENCS